MTQLSPGLTYRLLALLLLPLWFVHALWHGHRQKFSNYLKLRRQGKKKELKHPVVWVHAASVGEVEAVTPLVMTLHDQGEAILFTSFTATGHRAIQRNFVDSVEQGVIPIDFYLYCQRFVRQHNIKLCLLMETELWPELLYQTAHKGIPVIQLNARLSRKSLEAPRLIRKILRRTMSYISLHLTRNDNDRDNLMQLGAIEERIKIVGNLKSAIDTSSNYENLIERDYLLIASSHEDEEKLLLSHRPTNLRKLLIVIAPRHPTRSKAIQQQLSELGINYATRSQSQPINPQTEVYLADTLGELKALMAHAQIVIMGGSFDQTGGHNLIEPAALGCAIITGPSDSNVREDIELLGDGKGILQVPNVTDCWHKIEHLLEHPDQIRELGIQARLAVRQRTHILNDYLTEINSYIRA